VEVRHRGATLPRRLHLVDPAGGVALLVALETVRAQISLACNNSRQPAQAMLIQHGCTQTDEVSMHDRLVVYVAFSPVMRSTQQAYKLAAAAAGCTFAAAVARAAGREVSVVHLDVVGEADDVLDAAAGSTATQISPRCATAAV
jgi:hypothetical protein